MTIEEKLDLLTEAEEFFAGLVDAWDKVQKLWLRKAAALATVKGWLDSYKEEMMWDRERTEEDLEAAMAIVFDKETIDDMAAHWKLEWEDLDFYLWGFGLAKGIIEWDKESIDGLRKLQAAYDGMVEKKLGHWAYFTLK